RRAYHRDESLPASTPGGMKIDCVSLGTCLDALTGHMDYTALRTAQAKACAEGRVLGIGVATFLEMSAPGSWAYGRAGVRVTSQDTGIVKMEPSGMVQCAVGCTEQGQGTITGVAQIVAEALGVPIAHIAVDSGDTHGPYGGGAWGSRGLSIGGEAAHRA